MMMVVSASPSFTLPFLLPSSVHRLYGASGNFTNNLPLAGIVPSSPSSLRSAFPSRTTPGIPSREVSLTISPSHCQAGYPFSGRWQFLLLMFKDCASPESQKFILRYVQIEILWSDFFFNFCKIVNYNTYINVQYSEAL